MGGVAVVDIGEAPEAAREGFANGGFAFRARSPGFGSRDISSTRLSASLVAKFW